MRSTHQQPPSGAGYLNHPLRSILLVTLLAFSAINGMVSLGASDHAEYGIEYHHTDHDAHHPRRGLDEWDVNTAVSGTRDGGNISILLVNGSSESTPIFQQIIEANTTYHLTLESEAGTDPDTWGEYDILVWSQGRKDANASLETELRRFVLDGGRLLVEGANLAEHAGTDEFENVVLRARSRDVSGLSNYVGQNLSILEQEHPISSRPNMLPDTITYPSNHTRRTDSDVCEPVNGSVVVLEWGEISLVNGTTGDNHGNWGGIMAYDDDPEGYNASRIVFFSFALSLVNGSSNRSGIVENALDWLAPREQGGERFYAFHLTPGFQEKTTGSGGTVTYQIRIMNTGTLNDTYDLSRQDPPPGWSATLNRTTVDVESGKNSTVSLTVTAPVTAQNGDHANISVLGESRGDPSLNSTAFTNTTVDNEATTDLEPVSLEPQGGRMLLGGETRITSRVRNNGDRDADNVLVAFFLETDPVMPLGEDVIDVPGRGEATAEILWNATGYFGDLILMVEVDPGQNHAETNETNNRMENATGDWAVSARDHATLTDATYSITGNLTIYGSMLLNSVIIELNSTGGTYGFFISSGGSLEADGTSFRPRGNTSDGDQTIRFQNRGMMALSNATISGLHFSGDPGTPRGGLELYSSASTLSNSRVTDSRLGVWTSVSPTLVNVSFHGISDIGIYSVVGSPILDSCTLDGMTTAIWFRESAGSIRSCTINNVSTGMFLDAGSNPAITDCLIRNLTGLRRGISVRDSSPMIMDSEIHTTNTAIWIEGKDSAPTLQGNDLSANDATGLYVKDGSALINDTLISDNAIYGIRIDEGGRVTVRNSTLLNNGFRGIFSYRGTLFMEDVTVEGKGGANYDEGIYAYMSSITLIRTTFPRWSLDLDMNLTRSTVLRSFDTIYNTVNLTGGSLIATGSLVTISVLDRSNAPIPNATVTIEDRDQETIFTGSSDNRGMCSAIPVFLHNETPERKDWYTPHRIDVQAPGGSGNRTVNLSQQQTVTITVNAPPVAVLQANRLTGSSETVFQFDGDRSHDDSLAIASYRFDLGDGTVTDWVSQSRVSHTYENAGYYTVSLVVKDYDGAVSTPDTLQIMINNPPRVTLPDKLVGKVGVNITFQADVFDPDRWDNLHYHWDFDDGASSTRITPVHAYNRTGYYFVVLTVRDDHGGVADAGMDVEIVLNRNPKADAGEDLNVTFRNGAFVQFTSYSSDPDGDTLSFVWDFGDESTSHQEHPNHFFREPGTYNVTLTVTDESGASDSDVIQVNVIEYVLAFPFERNIRGSREDVLRPTIAIQNDGSHDIIVNLTSLGNWLEITLKNITLRTGERRNIMVTVRIPRNAPMDISEQEFMAESGGIEFRSSLLVDVEPTKGIALSIQVPTTQTAMPGESITYSLKLTNTGSDRDSFRVQLASVPPGWEVVLNGREVASFDNIQPGSDVFISVGIVIPERDPGGQRTVSVMASSVSDPSVQGTVEIRTTVNTPKDDDDDSRVGTYLIPILLVVVLVIGFVIFRRNAQVTYAEDEDHDGGGDWDKDGNPEGDGDWDKDGNPEGDGFGGEGDHERIPSDPRAIGRSRPGTLKNRRTGDMEKKPPLPSRIKPLILKCPKCATLLEVPTQKRPITIECPGCGARAHIKK